MQTYTTQAKIEAFTGAALSSSQSAQITAWINAIEDWIDKFCDTSFRQSAGATKNYDGPGGKELLTDEFTGTPTIAFLDAEGDVSDTLAATDFVAHPFNETVKNRILLLDGGDYAAFPVGTYRVRVTGNFFHSSVPGPVELAATMMTAKFLSKGSAGGEVSSERLGEYQVTFKDVDEAADLLGVKSMLQPYRQLSI